MNFTKRNIDDKMDAFKESVMLPDDMHYEIRRYVSSQKPTHVIIPVNKIYNENLGRGDSIDVRKNNIDSIYLKELFIKNRDLPNNTGRIFIYITYMWDTDNNKITEISHAFNNIYSSKCDLGDLCILPPEMSRYVKYITISVDNVRYDIDNWDLSVNQKIRICTF